MARLDMDIARSIARAAPDAAAALDRIGAALERIAEAMEQGRPLLPEPEARPEADPSIEEEERRPQQIKGPLPSEPLAGFALPPLELAGRKIWLRATHAAEWEAGDTADVAATSKAGKRSVTHAARCLGVADRGESQQAIWVSAADRALLAALDRDALVTIAGMADMGWLPELVAAALQQPEAVKTGASVPGWD